MATVQHDFFVGIDSDGCAFDSMEIKHKECFVPNTIRHWGLQQVSTWARETAEFVNLYSRWRGQNRWIALLKTLELLAQRDEICRREASIPTGDRIREFVASGYPLSDDGLRSYAAHHPHPELDRALRWTRAVNECIGETVRGVPPFGHVRESVQRMNEKADLMVVSATSVEALEREWTEHDLARYISGIAGQETGTKAQHLRSNAVGKYPDGHILLIGDAPGDRNAANSVGALFYPINPGQEARSWKRFHDEALDRFLSETYAGEYEATLIAEFEQLLPETPPWTAGQCVSSSRTLRPDRHLPANP